MSIELRPLRYVVAAAENESFRRAAVALGVRESAVSRRIRDIGNEMGAALFIRHRSGVHLTCAGEVLLRRARRAINQVNSATKDVGAVGRGEDGVVRIGLFSSPASGFIAELIRAYDAAHAGISGWISPRVVLPSTCRPAVNTGSMSPSLTGTPAAAGCDVVHLWNERV